MPPRLVDVFFYGLFMDAAALRGRGLHPADPRPARVADFALRLGARATLLPEPGACAWGFVMGLSHSEIERLYSEPGVQVYRPEAVLAELADGSTAPALCFNLPTPPDPGEANPEYAAKLRELAARLGLPAAYVAGIR